MKNYNSNNPINGYGLNAYLADILEQVNILESSYASISYVDSQDLLKANLSGGNTFSGNQNFGSGNISTTGTINSISPNIFGYLTGITSNVQTQINSKANTSDLSNYRTITDSNTLLALKANLSGGNTFSGNQAFSNGSLSGIDTVTFNQGFINDNIWIQRNTADSRKIVLYDTGNHRFFNYCGLGNATINSTEYYTRFDGNHKWLRGKSDDSGADTLMTLSTSGHLTTIGSVNGATATEMGYLSGTTSSIQTQINNKANTSDLSSTYFTIANAANKSNLVGGTSGSPQVFTGYHTLDGLSGYFCNASANEIGYLVGVSSPLQTQIGTINTTLNGKATLNATCNWSANHTWSSNNLSGINDLTFVRMFTSGIQYISRNSTAKKLVFFDGNTAKIYNDYSIGIGTNAFECNIQNVGSFTWHVGNSGDTAKTELMRLTNAGNLSTIGTVTGTNVLSTNSTDIASNTSNISTNTTAINNLKPGSGYYHKRTKISVTAGAISHTWNEGFNTGLTAISSNGLFLYPTSNYNSSNITFSIQVSGATPMINVCIPSVSQLEINLYDLAGNAVNWSSFSGTVYVQSMSS